MDAVPAENDEDDHDVPLLRGFEAYFTGMPLAGSDWIIWAGIAFCLSQSAMFSGLNLAYFSVGRLNLEAKAEHGNRHAAAILRLRRDSNFLLCTILWGNVSVNVLLALLSESVLAGVGGFVFSTVGITFFGEIIPQAYFSRHAMRIGGRFVPMVRFYQVLLFPFAKSTALILDRWIGREGPSFYPERDLEAILRKHILDETSEISATEGRGALNFLSLDDRLIAAEGTPVDPVTIYGFPMDGPLPALPDSESEEERALIGQLQAHEDKWAVITDPEGVPRLVLETEMFLLHVLADRRPTDIHRFCHRPIVVDDPKATLESVLDRFVVEAEHHEDRVVDRDVVLFWTPESKRIITGPDILGRLLQGIARRVAVRAPIRP